MTLGFPLFISSIAGIAVSGCCALWGVVSIAELTGTALTDGGAAPAFALQCVGWTSHDRRASSGFGLVQGPRQAGLFVRLIVTTALLAGRGFGAAGGDNGFDLMLRHHRATDVTLKLPVAPQRLVLHFDGGLGDLGVSVEGVKHRPLIYEVCRRFLALGVDKQRHLPGHPVARHHIDSMNSSSPQTMAIDPTR